MPARKRIFQAVFPAAAQATLPTPQATPVLGPGSFGGSSFTEASPTEQGDPAAEKIKWERAWHTATFFLKLPDAPITLAAASRDEASLRAKWLRPCRPETSAAITYLVSEQSRGRRLRTGRKEDDLLDWYAQEVGRHYIEYQLPLLLHVRLHSYDV
jgi:anaphase-promoting complex subunit 2